LKQKLQNGQNTEIWIQYPSWGKVILFLYPNFVFLAMTFEPEMLESQSKTLKTQIMA